MLKKSINFETALMNRFRTSLKTSQIHAAAYSIFPVFFATLSPPHSPEPFPWEPLTSHVAPLAG